MITQYDIDNLEFIMNIIIYFRDISDDKRHLPNSKLKHFRNTINKIKGLVDKDYLYTREQYNRLNDVYHEYESKLKQRNEVVKLIPIDNSQLLSFDKSNKVYSDWIKESIEIRDRYKYLTRSPQEIFQAKQPQQYKSDNDRMRDFINKEKPYYLGIDITNPFKTDEQRANEQLVSETADKISDKIIDIVKESFNKTKEQMKKYKNNKLNWSAEIIDDKTAIITRNIGSFEVPKELIKNSSDWILQQQFEVGEWLYIRGTNKVDDFLFRYKYSDSSSIVADEWYGILKDKVLCDQRSTIFTGINSTKATNEQIESILCAVAKSKGLVKGALIHTLGDGREQILYGEYKYEPEYDILNDTKTETWVYKNGQWATPIPELTYEMICEELNRKGKYINPYAFPCQCVPTFANKILDNLNAQIKLINCALYFNGDEKIDFTNINIRRWCFTLYKDRLSIDNVFAVNYGQISFSSKESAEMTLKLLGESVIKQALNLIN